jgi:stage IV sporulation protein FB
LFATEPPPTNYDLHFSIAGIPVRIHPFFWLAAVILGARSTTNNPDAGTDLLIWVLVVLVSILVHELGHAFVMRYFGEVPRVVLYMMGGLAIADRGYGRFSSSSSQRQANSQIMISAAGPGAGFLLAGSTVLILVALGGSFMVQPNRFPGWTFSVAPGTSRELAVLFNDLLWVNIFWGVLNLLPVLPLDGGQIARELLTRWDPASGVVTSLWLSFFTATILALGGLLFLGSILMAVLFGSLAYSSYMALQQFGGGGGFGGGRPW